MRCSYDCGSCSLDSVDIVQWHCDFVWLFRTNVGSRGSHKVVKLISNKLERPAAGGVSSTLNQGAGDGATADR